MSPTPPKISVITPSFNSIRTIRETIESVRSQNYPNLEHIVMDGGSRDGTLELLKQTPEVSWLSEKDAGIYDAINKGIARATGDVIGILNSDDRYRPGALSAIGKAFAQNPDWDAAFGDIIFIDEHGKDIYRRREAKFDYDVLRLGRICYIIHPTLFVRKRVYHELGGYRNADYLRSADYEFILRLGKNGCRVGHLRQFLAEFRYHAQGQTSDFRVLAKMREERSRILAEYGVPDGITGAVLCALMRLKRQTQKLIYRGSLDLRRGDSFLRHHRHKEGTFSSNIPSETLEF